ncbi:division plane positioning ATPase MipZ [Notoacmeibacter sp. MSK16QG-6]|uniref:division plane positioning ATPase MipZ n=1 Tax=Notoacmeibacter sp. MSK16QG-6 TaxID=2957982 RepID=UPI00209FC4A9|nr:division plane positioning ATPase MipZ [Notoacmeibacter sp. MSK16QG-6]MCP1199316.1 division plane positioning ATPase MipZ [Notoacmeibacter sp. MSK16QG-6]
MFGWRCARKARQDGPAHLLVCGNEKGGSGKSTLGLHIATDLLNKGLRVGIIDLDIRQQTMARFFAYRAQTAAIKSLSIAHPRVETLAPVRRDRVSDVAHEERCALFRLLLDMRNDCDIVIVDTPGASTNLSDIAHSQADTLITPMNDSFVDFDVLGRIDPVSGGLENTSQYTDTVRQARRERRRMHGAMLDWVVVRNRQSTFSSRNERKVDSGLRQLAMQLGFRLADGIGERVVYRELFPLGLTVMDAEALYELNVCQRNSPSHLAACREIGRLVRMLRLPVDEDGRQRLVARQALCGAETLQFPVPEFLA